jgi:putative peptide zinc metalloprotease protein
LSTLVTEPLPARKPSLVIRPFNKSGEYVVKDPTQRIYLHVGEQEQFLLTQLDGRRGEQDVLASFQAQFHDPLSSEDLHEFLKMASERGLLNDGKAATAFSSDKSDDDEEDEVIPEGGGPRKQTWLYFRYSFLNPDRIFTVLAPPLGFVWTKAFFWTSLATIAYSGVVSWINRHELITSFGANLNWETIALAWVITIVVTTLHEFAHGLTCKRYGGEVRELGVLFMFFTPCFYCNVSDAWLIPEKSKRLWVTAAGGYCDLCLWAVAVLFWRVTHQDTLVNYVAWVVMSVCGFRGLINMNPLMRLDGYYLLSDGLEIPNLRKRARKRWMATLRCLLWGAPRPEPEAKGWFLNLYGGFRWVFYIAFLDLMYVGLCRWLGERWGWPGLALATYLAYVIIKSLFSGFFAGELKKMISTRSTRTKIWIAGLIAAAIAVFVVKIDDRAAGSFTVRPAKHLEVRAPVAGFLREVRFDMGDRLPADVVLGRFEIPDLESLISQKTSQQKESEANLRRLTAGPRPEEVREQTLKVERARAWYELGEQDLRRARQALVEELARADQQIAAARAEAEYAAASLRQAEQLYQRGVMAGQQFMGERKRFDVAVLNYQQIQAQRRAREASGTLDAEAEAARRKKELADVEAALKLMHAGGRPEEIEAEQARLARITEELAHLVDTRSKLEIRCPLAGVMTTARMKEKVGQYFEKGALICVVEDAQGLEAELALPEQEVNGVQEGQTVELKARSLPFQTFKARVDRVAPRAEKEQGALEGKVVVYCTLENGDTQLLAGMTGMGRVFRGERAVADVLTRKALRQLRTEFWW